MGRKDQLRDKGTKQFQSLFTNWSKSSFIQSLNCNEVLVVLNGRGNESLKESD